MNFSKASIVLVTLAALLAALPAAQAACTDASFKGVYGVLSSGLNGSGQPASSVDHIVADGAGSLTGSSTKSIDGTLVTFTFTGTYQLNKDCTGNASFNNQDGSTKHVNIYVNSAKKGAFLIQTDAQHTESSVLAAQGAAKCTDLGVKHTYSLKFEGVDLKNGTVAVAGQVSFDGTGSVKSGVATFSINGSIANSLPLSGTYHINSDCTGTAQITTQLGVSNLALVVVNVDKEILALQTDSGTIVAGTLLQ